MEMLDEDYKLTPSGYLGCNVRVSTDRNLGEFSSTAQALEFVQDDMEENQFWPNIWWVSDHGNTWLIDVTGQEIIMQDD